jgi:hypothetical protein
MKTEAKSRTIAARETVYLIILDECHYQANENKLFHKLCNDDDVMQLDNFVVLLISATPYNNRR